MIEGSYRCGKEGRLGPVEKSTLHFPFLEGVAAEDKFVSRNDKTAACRSYIDGRLHEARISTILRIQRGLLLV
jgi:hypothetical protein